VTLLFLIAESLVLAEIAGMERGYRVSSPDLLVYNRADKAGF
jgi:hypothetical protein